MLSKEERVMKRISKMLSKLEPEAAASIARQVADSYRTDVSLGETDGTQPPKLEPQQPEDDSFKPAFMRTQHRMTIGKEILERDKESDK